MRKVIAAINMTLDGVFDHTALDADDEIHEHYTNLINSAGIILYGRITYKLMEDFWPTVVKSPTGNKSLDDFAVAMENIPKVVFSRTMNSVSWDSSRLATQSPDEEVAELRQQPGKDIMIGSRSLIISLLNMHMVDEFQILIGPSIAGKGMHLFDHINDRINLRLIKTKTLANTGSVILYYAPQR